MLSRGEALTIFQSSSSNSTKQKDELFRVHTKIYYEKKNYIIKIYLNEKNKSKWYKVHSNELIIILGPIYLHTKKKKVKYFEISVLIRTRLKQTIAPLFISLDGGDVT